MKSDSSTRPRSASEATLTIAMKVSSPFDKDAYRAAVHREVAEELKFEGMWEDRLAALINDDSTEVGQVHLGVVHVVALRHAAVRAREQAIRELRFLVPQELRKQRDKLESWSQIVLDAWETL